VTKAARETGAPLPKFVLDAPVLEDSYQRRVLDAFWKLSTCREVGMAIGPIPWSDAHTFARVHQFDADQVEYDTFMQIITEMDQTFIEYQKDETERRATESPAGKGLAPRRVPRGKRR
jgi:hypothetical protein